MAKFSLDTALKNVQKVIKEEVKTLSEMEPAGLYEPVRYTLDLGGKRLRPLILWLTARTIDPKAKLSDASPLMKAVEVFHNFSLIHDDLMDDAPIRRGKPTVYKKWNANQAVLSGDAMLIEAYTALSGARPELVPVYLTAFNSMAAAVCIGQQMDMEYESEPLSEVDMEDYFQMISYKTGALLVGSSILGAILGGIEEEELDHLQSAVSAFGAAFQVMDDYLDVFSDVEEFGKRHGGDILEGKKTFLLIDAYAKEPEAVERILALEDDEEKIKAMTALYKEVEADKDALSLVKYLTDQSGEMLRGLPYDTSILQELFVMLLSRHS